MLSLHLGSAARDGGGGPIAASASNGPQARADETTAHVLRNGKGWLTAQRDAGAAADHECGGSTSARMQGRGAAAPGKPRTAAGRKQPNGQQASPFPLRY